MADETKGAIEAPITINIGNVCDGAAVDAFEKKLAEVLRNICDLGTPATAVRTITLKVRLKPREDRVQINTEFTCEAKLASFEPKTSRIFVAADKEGNLYGLSEDPRQIALFQPPKPREAPPVITFKPAAEK